MAQLVISSKAKFKRNKLKLKKCQLCDVSYQTKFCLSLHRRSHRSNRKNSATFHCKKCNKGFLKSKLFESHKFFHQQKLRSKLQPKDRENNVYKCPYCKTEFSGIKYLALHKRSCSKKTINRTWKCNECDKVFASKHILYNHQSLVHTQDFPFKCKICGKGCTTIKYLKTHCRVHSEDKLFICEYCGRKFNWEKDLQKHLKIHSGEMPYKCNECGKEFVRMTHLYSHQIYMHNFATKNQCPDCRKGFASVSNLIVHMRTHTGEKPFVCSDCGKGFNQKGNLERHSQIHMDKKEMPYHCNKCEKEFANISQLDSHQIYMHNKTTENQCRVCKKGFPSSYTLTIHMRVHTGEKPFICKTCGKGFIRKSRLTEHHRIHTEDKPFSSDECKKPFINENNLFVHSKIRPIVCNECGKEFKHNSYLVRHSWTHREDKNFVCNECGKGFKYSSHLMRHSWIHRGEKQFDYNEYVKGLGNQSRLVAHIRIQSKERAYGCYKCGKRFYRKYNLARHYRIHYRIYSREKYICLNKTKLKKCQFCDVSYQSKFCLSLHGSTHRSNIKTSTTFHCKKCNKRFLKSKLFECHKFFHQKKLRSKLFPKDRENNGYQCEDCKTKFSGAKYLALHKRSFCKKRVNRTWKCNECDKIFVSKQLLYNHQLSTHFGIHSKDKLCEYCGRKFNRAKDLKKHLKIHSGKMPCKCNECGKEFVRMTHLYSHQIYMHNFEAKNQCPHCRKGFASVSNLIVHMRTHTGEKPFICSGCGKGFNQKGNLERHSQIHMEKKQKPHRCNKCEKEFVNISQLGSHQIYMHNKKTDYQCGVCKKGFPSRYTLNIHLRIHTDDEKPLV